MLPAEIGSPESRPLRRVDARRNRERILVEANRAFAAHGTSASLENIARAAGLGIATLYRHFPTREALLEALLHKRFQQLWERARALAGSDSPADALEAWLRDVAEQSATYRGLPSSMMAALDDDTSRLATSCQATREVGARLLEEAQRVGEIRSDVDATDLIVLANAVAWAAQQDQATSGRIHRHLVVLMAGLRTRAAVSVES